MRVNRTRMVPLLLVLPLVGIGTAHLASNVVPPDWDRDRLVAAFSTEWVPTIPLFSSLLHIRDQPPS